MTTISGKKELDHEWIELIKQAQEIGISFEEIRSFLHNATTPKYSEK
ncbi:anti-repressor SinI family protein [Neobacillus niacini]|nr:anti-repressor SinI family protein [Neobacillus niacini]MEC1520579.1 anti-repressor SinI family protein [Neobacillus niacini]